MYDSKTWTLPGETMNLIKALLKSKEAVFVSKQHAQLLEMYCNDFIKNPEYVVDKRVFKCYGTINKTRILIDDSL